MKQNKPSKVNSTYARASSQVRKRPIKNNGSITNRVGKLQFVVHSGRGLVAREVSRFSAIDIIR